MAAAFYWWQSARGRSWRALLTVALVGGLLGTVALGALAGARRTASAYGRYLTSINASDVFVNIPSPYLPGIAKIARLPAVRKSAAWLGLAANPVIHGRVDYSFLDDNLVGSYNGDFFRQDRMTVVSGRLPRLDSTSEIALNQSMARELGVGVGGRVTWAFERLQLPSGRVSPAGRSTFVVTGIVDIPPVLTDQFDDAATAVLPPAATARYLNGEFIFVWVGLRLTAGAAGIAALQSELDGLARQEERILHIPHVNLTIRRMDTVHNEVQQAIRPQAVALAVFGALAALAMLILVGQGLAQLLSRPAAEISVLRAVGATRIQTALAIGLDGAIAVIAAVALAIVGAYAVSPLAPVGPVHRFDPARGFEADPLVLAGGGAVLAVALLGLLAVMAWRRARPDGGAERVRRPLAIAAAAASAGLPVAAVIGTRHALERGSGQRPAAVRAVLFGSVAAVTAVVAATIFWASLDGLISHPARYGWNWDLLIDAQGGYGNWRPAVMDRLVGGQPGVTGWSQFGFTQVPIDGQEVPAMGLLRELGSVEPPTISGHPIAGPGQIELGTSTLRQLGKHIGDTVTVGSGNSRRWLEIVGTVTLPSFGLILADHVSLGRGAMLPDSTLLATQGVTANCSNEQAGSAFPACPSAVAIDTAPGHPADARRLVSRIISADPDGSPYSTYPLGPERGAAILNASQMGSQPLTLALSLAAAAVLALALTVLTSVRQRRRQLAVLKTLGLQRHQLRAIVAWQASIIMAIAALIGIPLGVAVGRWAWANFAYSVGFDPVSVVPVLALFLGFLGLLAAGSLLAAAPAMVAARTPPAAALRAE